MRRQRREIRVRRFGDVVVVDVGVLIRNLLRRIRHGDERLERRLDERRERGGRRRRSRGRRARERRRERRRDGGDAAVFGRGFRGDGDESQHA